MIRAQRRWHARLWIILGPLVLGGLITALLRRPAIPIQPAATVMNAAAAERGGGSSEEGRP